MSRGYGDVIKIISEDCTGRKTMRKTANADDADSVASAFNSVIEKYGLNIKINKKEQKDTGDPWVEKTEEFKW